MEDISDDVVQDKAFSNEQDFSQDTDSCDLIKDGVKKEPRKKVSLTSLPTPHDETTLKDMATLSMFNQNATVKVHHWNCSNEFTG